MNEEPREDFAEDAADATEEARRRRGEDDERIEDQPESSRLVEGPASDDEPDARV